MWKNHIFVFFFIISVVIVKYTIRLFLKRDRRLLEFCLTWLANSRISPATKLTSLKTLIFFLFEFRERKKCLMSKIEEAIIWRIFLIESLLLCIEFHHHVTRSFFRRKFCRQLFCTYILGLAFLAEEYRRKCARVVLVKLTRGFSLIEMQMWSRAW